MVAGIALTTALLVTGVLVLGVGSVRIPAGDVLDVVLRRMWPGHADVSPVTDRIVWELRLPRVLAAAAVGAGLALCGAALQSLTGNDLADPYLLGVSSGAALGAVMTIVLGWTPPPDVPAGLATSVGAFAGALGALVLVLALAAGRSGDLPPARTILAGVAVAQLAGAGTSLVVMVFGDRQGAREVLAWTLGSFAGVRTTSAWVLVAGAVLATVLLTGSARTLDAFAFGETSARSLGVDVGRARWTFFVGCALVTAGTVAVVGPIGFVGLTVPHVVRLVVGPAHAFLLPLSALTGALLMVWSDTAARSLASGQEIPVGVVTALVGAPVLVVLLRRQARQV
ncbi:FecCD family ABC transporter permease [Mobilicoccus pelagius]|uniref:Putative ABC transporter permease protein n=1 Tax=Mobilicoccus pelagius NBRC 104925 TaxID=1089455 RepID=H5UNM2_9MICO|nr:iron chelate uptake ABC transporter family permease subunit [Mobilicoccus pelagius]GAB47330.1 putative ABC transporter permease protein [Mobilicoccus pelagius NBRC 104925]